MLYEHQKKAVNFALQLDGCCALFHEPGCGKTLTSLEIFKQLRQRNESLQMLVVCPKSLINPAWRADTNKFTDFSYSFFKENKITDITSINYEMFIRPANKAKIINMVSGKDWMCVLDESSKIKSNTSQITKTLLDLSYLFKHRIILSGTPCPNGEVELWAQINFIRPWILFRSFYKFRNTFFHLTRDGNIANMQGMKMTKHLMKEMFSSGWKYTLKSREMLTNYIADYVDTVKKDEALDLPEKIDVIREVELSTEEMRAYKQMKKHLIAEFKDVIIPANTMLSKMMKLRQICSGFLYNEETGIKHIGKSKLKVLLQILEELGRKKVIIWCQFKGEIQQLHKELKNSTTLYSQTEDKDASIAAFKADTQYLIAHPRSAAHGLTLTEADTQIFYSLDYSCEAYLQARDRTHRIGQTRKCLYIHLLCKDTIDYNILSIVQGKKSVEDAVMDMLK